MMAFPIPAGKANQVRACGLYRSSPDTAANPRRTAESAPSKSRQ